MAEPPPDPCQPGLAMPRRLVSVHLHIAIDVRYDVEFINGAAAKDIR
jgi:hypothetical protein